VRIVLMGYANMKAAVDAINKGGAYRYIGKPWNGAELVVIVQEAATRCNLVQENKRLTGTVRRQNAELQQWNSQLEYFVQLQTVEIQNKNDELGRVNDRPRR
jgi:response regulator RpfG family c-di-GMP phosphodiesterase